MVLELSVALGGSLKNLIRFTVLGTLMNPGVFWFKAIELHHTCNRSNLIQGDFGIPQVVG